ncbi:transcription initiation factor TFIID subunit 9-like [Primulina huaijiensis]|uniref:transcription initiation factor TFIID subunit 9-like n=1 Tax=Primulina huaijiensis TaxID=1492673 RepID=UPI003CC74525
MANTEDAKIVKTLLKSLNVDDFEPQLVHQCLELWYRYVVDVLTDAQVYSEHSGKSKIDSDDVKLAIQSKVNNFSLSQPPPRLMLLELARSRNKIPLPKSITQYGIPLPPEQDTLISPNYQLSISKMHGGQPVEEREEDEEGVDPNPTALPASKLSQDHSALPQGTTQRVSFPLGTKHPR